MLPLRYSRIWIAIAWALVAAAFYFSLAPAGMPGMRGLFRLNDKVEHAVGYCVLTIVFAGLYPKSRYGWIVLGLFSMGVLVEFLQGWMAMGRERDMHDVLANSAGIAAGLLVSLTVLKDWLLRVERRLPARDR